MAHLNCAAQTGLTVGCGRQREPRFDPTAKALRRSLLVRVQENAAFHLPRCRLAKAMTDGATARRDRSATHTKRDALVSHVMHAKDVVAIEYAA